MSTLRISNIEAKSVPASATVDEKVKITNSSGDPLVFIDGKTSGITTVGINTTDPNITFDANSNVVVTGIITATKFSGQFEPTSVGIADSIFHTGDTDTKIQFDTNTINFHTNGVEVFRITPGGHLSLLPADKNLYLPNTINHSGDSDTFFGFPADDTIAFDVGGTERLRINSSGLVNIGAGSSASGLSPLLHLHKNASSSTAYLHITNNSTGITNNDGFLLGINGVGDCLVFNKDSTPIRFATAGIERVRIGAGGSVTHYCGSANSQGFFVLGHASQGRTTLAVRAGNTNSNAATSIRLQHANGTSVGSLSLDNDSDNYNLMNAVQGGQIVFHTNESGSSLPKMRIHPDGDVQLTSGNLVVSSGNGIDFSATSDGSGTTSSEILDEYEEGYYTPTATVGSGSITSTTSFSLRYVKIGGLVHLFGRLHFNTSAFNLTSFSLSLPFTNNTANRHDTSGVMHLIRGNGGDPVQGIRIFRITPGSTTMDMQTHEGTANGNLGTNTPHLSVNICYFSA